MALLTTAYAVKISDYHGPIGMIFKHNTWAAPDTFEYEWQQSGIPNRIGTFSIGPSVSTQDNGLPFADYGGWSPTVAKAGYGLQAAGPFRIPQLDRCFLSAARVASATGFLSLPDCVRTVVETEYAIVDSPAPAGWATIKVLPTGQLWIFRSTKLVEATFEGIIALSGINQVSPGVYDTFPICTSGGGVAGSRDGVYQVSCKDFVTAYLDNRSNYRAFVLYPLPGLGYALDPSEIDEGAMKGVLEGSSEWNITYTEIAYGPGPETALKVGVGTTKNHYMEWSGGSLGGIFVTFDGVLSTDDLPAYSRAVYALPFAQ